MSLIERPQHALEYRQRNVEFRIVPDGKAEGRVLADVLVYNRVDDYRTSFRQGSFTDSLSDHLPTMVWGHNWLEPIGQWVDADDNQTRMRLLGQLDLERDVETRAPIVPQAHRAWLQLQKRTVNQFSIGFVRLQDQPHREIRGAKEVVKGWLDEVSPVVVGSVPGTGIVSTRARQVLRESVLGRGERRTMFNVETRANPTGINQYTGGHSGGSVGGGETYASDAKPTSSRKEALSSAYNQIPTGTDKSFGMRDGMGGVSAVARSSGHDAAKKFVKTAVKNANQMPGDHREGIAAGATQGFKILYPGSTI